MKATGPRHLFVHLQKTGGTAVLKRLRHHFGADAVYPRPHEQGTPEAVLDVAHLQARLAGAGDGVQVVTGHFPLCVADLLGPDVATFTVLREPVERILSFLRHQREVVPELAASPLEDIYEHPLTDELVTNHMVRMLSLSVDEMTDGALTAVTVDDDRLARAEAGLARVDVVGLQEHFEVFCADLEVAFGWDLGDPLYMNRTQPYPASDALRRRITADNAYDAALYERARAQWAARH